MRLKSLALGAAFALAGAAAAHADTVTYVLPDIGTYASYTTNDTGATFTGDGFSGMYAGEWGHLFGLEGDYSRTVAQVGIGGLSGHTVSSATFSFQLLEAYTAPATVTVTGFGGNGNLAFSFAAPAATYGTTQFALVGGLNTFDLTDIVSAAVAANEDFLGLHFQSSLDGNWTYTYAGYGFSADRAEARLTVNSTASAAVPEPVTWALMIGGFGGVGTMLRRRRAVLA